jgi:hypothetical protein
MLRCEWAESKGPFVMARRREPVTDPSEPVADAPVEAPVEAVPEVVDADLAPPVAEVPAASDPQVPPPAAPAQEQRPGLIAPLLGGALAAIGGFGLSHFDLLGLASSDQGLALTALEARLAEAEAGAEADRAALAALKAELAPLANRLTALESAPAPAGPDPERLDALDQRLSVIEALPAGDAASTAALAAKLAELEGRLAAQPQAVDQAEVDAALARLSAAEAEATRRAEEAAAAAEVAARADALGRLAAAVAEGAPFQAELDALADPALTEALAPHTAGVATVAALQADFPDLAREALALSRADDSSQGWGGRLVDFLAAQTGARALTPRDGDAPDAILSRAEFALAEGRLADALAEVQTLDPAVQAPFADWAARAAARLSVLAALEGR